MAGTDLTHTDCGFEAVYLPPPPPVRQSPVSLHLPPPAAALESPDGLQLPPPLLPPDGLPVALPAVAEAMVVSEPPAARGLRRAMFAGVASLDGVGKQLCLESASGALRSAIFIKFRRGVTPLNADRKKLYLESASCPPSASGSDVCIEFHVAEVFLFVAMASFKCFLHMCCGLALHGGQRREAGRGVRVSGGGRAARLAEPRGLEPAAVFASICR